ncbi:MAG TPA: Cu(I)-responsive transcriptional regulator [Candidatus Competibacteraceae bacterium]|nr:Cu(I)-responsive transcriptional regulator [Candidatus Competibacteraceae bacterium]
MNIGQAAKASGVSAKMIRHYEAIGLIPQAGRSFSNYRTYNERDVHTLRFIRQARSLGFSIKSIETLLDLWRDQHRASAEVKAIALAHIAELETRICELQAMRDALRYLAEHCQGDERPDCPILDGLAEAQEVDWCQGGHDEHCAKVSGGLGLETATK